MKEITSVQNAFVKSLVQLQEKARLRKQAGQFLIEGRREIGLARNAGYAFDYVLFCPGLAEAPDLSTGKTEIVEISREVYEKLAYRDSTEGLLVVAQSRPHALEDLALPENPLVLVAEAPEKPGNIGALLRTADAAGFDAVIIANPRTDLYNPNVVRSSVGAIFTVPVAMGTTQDIIAFLIGRNIAIYSAILQEAVPYHSVDFTKPSAIVVGTEDAGLSQAWRQSSERNIIIPMHGALDSMNVSVASGILMFEARRQRGFH